MIESANIRDHWERLRPTLSKMLRNHPENPEDVYAAVVAGGASLFTVRGQGYLVLRIDTNFSTRERELFVWIAATEEHDLYGEALKELQAMAKELDCKYITFCSRRKGWERRPEWSARYTTYEMRV